MTRPAITMERIQRETGLHHRIGLEKLLCDDRRWEWSHPRQEAIYLSRRLRIRGRRRTWAMIGKQFNRSPWTVRDACTAVEARLRTDPKTRDDVGAILNRLFS